MSAPATPAPFSLSEGGRLHDALVRAGLAGSGRGRLVQVAVFLAIGWLPLVLLAAAAGTATGGVSVPLFEDLRVWVRFFVVVPVLILAEPFADRALSLVLDQFRGSGLLAGEARERFDRAVAATQRAATSDTVEFVIIALALALPHLASAPVWMSDRTTWLVTAGADGPALSAAGRWVTWVSLPLVEFLLMRWLWRTLMWWRLLWRISRLPLAVAPSHPDRSGGLAFLSYAPTAFLPVFVGLSALAAVGISTQLRYGASRLADARGEVIAFVVLELVLLLVPQFFFLPAQGRARRLALMRFEVAGAAMSRRFEERWTGPAADGADELLDSGHSGSMADFASTCERVAAMRPVSLSLRQVIATAVPLLAPFAPLLLFEYSITQILKQVLEMVR